MENNTDEKHTGSTPQDIEIRGGDILVSSPLLNDPNFKRTAVLILEKDPLGGFLGLVLNRELDLTLENVCKMPGSADSMPVFNGGPVDLQRMFWLHTLGSRLKNAYEVLPGLYVGGEYDPLIEAFAEGEDLSGKIRFFLGYSGWSRSQLENEIRAGAWAVIHDLLNPGLLVEEMCENLWQTLTRNLGPTYRHWLSIPADPNLN